MPSASPARSAARSRRAAQRRDQPALRVEPADVDIAKMQVMNGDVAGDRQPFLLRGPHHRDALGRREPAQVDAHAGGADQREDRRQRDRLRRRRNRRQAEARGDLAVVRDAAPARDSASCGRSQTRWPKVAAYCIARSSTPVSVSGASACENATQPASASSPISVSSTPLRPTVSAPTGIDVRLVERARAMLQHLDQARLVERRIGIRRAGETRHASGHGRVHLRFERGLVFETRLAQPRGEIDQTRADDQPARVEHAIGAPAGRRRADARPPCRRRCRAT